ncbi:MAG: D-aminoacylase [Cytophagales bacterium]|nr:D-aminoacylase [Bernardetiaceae bacterium]MDW8204418.1 D-aminoacylase [Cytophagales bacterium]
MKTITILRVAALWVLSLLSPAITHAQYDLLILNGRLVDGTGNPWYQADLAIKNGRIAAIGRLREAHAAKVIDAQRHIVAPGFIDVHTHIEGSIQELPLAENFIYDGVTTLITGNCGSSFTDLKKFFRELDSIGISPNVGTLAGHNAIRRAVMRLARRDPTPEEQAKMEAIMERMMLEGALGLSSGLIYIPGAYSKTQEIAGLAKVAARYGGVYATHMRNEADSVMAAIGETLEIGRQSSIPIQISHFKASGHNNWGRSREMLAAVERARAEGLDVNLDQYPYPASSTNLGVLLPAWALADGDSAIRARLTNPTIRAQIEAEIAKNMAWRSRSGRMDYAYVARYVPDSTYQGLNISQITAKRLGKSKTKLKDEIQTVIEMMLNGGAQMIYHSMSEEDVARIMASPLTMIASDAGIYRFGKEVPHPRGYGSNARVLGRYVREQKLFPLEEAIRKMTSMPAQRFGITDRGLLRQGYQADIVIFDPATVADRATFEKPHAYSQGFRYVIVNGKVVVEEGKHTGARPGMVIRGKGYRPDY